LKFHKFGALQVIKGRTQVSLSEFVTTPRRSRVADFLPTHFNRYVLIGSIRTPDIDWGFFMRPFSEASWTAQIVSILVILFMHILHEGLKLKGYDGFLIFR